MICHGYLIDSTKREITPVTFNDLDELQTLVGGHIELAYTWANGDTLYVDEEGLLKAPNYYFALPHERPDQPFAGNGVLVGREIGDTDDTEPPVITLAALKAKIAFGFAR